MLFNSYIFIFVFLPIVLLGSHLIGRRFHYKFAIAWLVLASLFFYGWRILNYLWLIVASILVNYAFGISLAGKPSIFVLSLGIATNLSALAYFKYTNFFVEILGAALDINWHLNAILLILAISFFTFQQIARLVDTQNSLSHKFGFLRYCLFVPFFPQLIAGQNVHHREMLPQFAKETLYRLNTQLVAVGITFFAIGLFKKTVIADGMALYATPVFDHALAVNY
jgi:alginate O-acetyltransferase complex protein AlgI